MVKSGKIQRLLLIVVNAQVVDENDVDVSSHSPGVERNGAIACSPGSTTGCLSMFYTVEVSFDQIVDADERRFFEHLPTTYALDARVVDALISRGGQLLRTHPEYNRLLCDLDRGDWKKRGALADCRDRAYQGH